MPRDKFDAEWWNIWKMRDQANAAAEKSGHSGGETGPFRHAYVSAKIADRYDASSEKEWFPEGKSAVGSIAEKMLDVNIGEDLNHGKTYSRIFGGFNELFGKDFFVDTASNEIGLMIRDEVERDVFRMKQEWNLTDEQADEWRERLLKTRISEAVKKGELKDKW